MNQHSSGMAHINQQSSIMAHVEGWWSRRKWKALGEL